MISSSLLLLLFVALLLLHVLRHSISTFFHFKLLKRVFAPRSTYLQSGFTQTLVPEDNFASLNSQMTTRGSYFYLEKFNAEKVTSVNVTLRCAAAAGCSVSAAK